MIAACLRWPFCVKREMGMGSSCIKFLSVGAATLALIIPIAHAQSPYESSADFARYAMKLRAQALLKVEPQVFVPTTSRFSSSRYPWKTDIATTIFWIGEQPTANNPVPNHKSSWDAQWARNYGGYDN